MPNVLPSRVDLLLCDAVRQEMRNKMSLLGFFVGPNIRIDPGTPYPVSFPLGAVFLIADGEGTFRNELVVHVPGSNPTTLTLPDIVKRAGDAAAAVVSFNMFVVPAPGTVDMEFKLDGHPFHRNFTVI